MYEPRAADRLAPGEPIRIYAELVVRKCLRDGDFRRFGFTVDLLVLDKDGDVLAGEENGTRTDLASRSPA